MKKQDKVPRDLIYKIIITARAVAVTAKNDDELVDRVYAHFNSGLQEMLDEYNEKRRQIEVLEADLVSIENQMNELDFSFRNIN